METVIKRYLPCHLSVMMLHVSCEFFQLYYKANIVSACKGWLIVCLALKKLYLSVISTW